MNPALQEIYRCNDSFSFRLHEQAQRYRARAIAALFARLIERLSAPRRSQVLSARWG